MTHQVLSTKHPDFKDTAMTPHEADARFISWLRNPTTTRQQVVAARDRARRDWQYQAAVRELERREGVRKSYG